ncbi:MAG: ABC transporter permease subunit [Pseudomonadota bacterium]|nr:ABC transporter permease subunit [Pseudomonadota bacterium]MEC8020153.1 ABC transporter permease subunit [Pseudomonadota bacterium]MEC8497713.1 ABC transporter permease subunit [Pseudomonadota bacterium]MEC8797867.1 ABC transporter permease subunit [Pseudomonadota bacterium]|tara:strand:- start:103 stop:996 length:894 start_codon:yes stop_codon:yes gene_type:complete
MNKKHIKIIEDYSNIKGRSLWVDARRRLFQNKAAVVSLFLIFLVAFLSFFGPFFLKYSFSDTDWNSIYYPPSLNNGHFLGTDGNGRDLLVRILYGGRLSLTIGILATLVSVFIGVIYGTIAGYFGGKLDIFMMRVVEILYAMPYLIFVILLMVVFGRNIYFLFIAIGAVEWLTMARIVRGQTISLKEKEFIETSKALGQSNFMIIWKHIIPNLAGPIVVYITLMVPSVIILESFLSFLGLGVQEPLTSWGVLISEGSREMETAWWLLIFPGIFMTITLASLNFIGDGLRDAIDPKEY